jgi:hypothetical protein
VKSQHPSVQQAPKLTKFANILVTFAKSQGMSVESIYKGTVTFVNNCVNTCLSVLKILFQSKFGLRMPSAESDKCIVLANGPSLKTSLEKYPGIFKKYPVVCVNTFSVTAEYALLKPRYYVILDPFFWKGSTEIIRTTIKCIEERTSWPMKLLVPQHAERSGIFNSLSGKNSNIEIVTFNYTVFKGFKAASHFFFRKNLAMPQSPNVSIASLFLSVNMGYKEIYLVGADHTWHENLHVNEDNILCTRNVHFYDNAPVTTYVPFLKEGRPDETQKTHEFFTIWSKTFYGYFLVNDYASYHKAKIWNASEVSFIDAFERKKLEA